MKSGRFLIVLCALALSLQLHAQWVCTWATAAEFTGPGDMPSRPLTDRSLREVVRVSVGADSFCLRLSNEFSREPVKIKSIYVADALDSCDIDRHTAKYLTFGGKKSVTIEPGKCVTSDVCKYQLRPLQRLSVTISYGNTPVNATSHRGSRTTSYLMDGVSRPSRPFVATERVDHWYNIASIDVPARGQECIAVLGNSITDGRGSTTNMQNRWPDRMAEALAAQGDKEYAVANLGIGGNCVVEGGLSEPALKRFDRDILAQQGVTTVIIYEGTNDIGCSGQSEQTVKKLIDAYKTLTEKARAKGCRVVGATILPFKGNGWYSYFHEAARRTVNDWIRTSGNFDQVIDFDELMRDPSDPERMRPEWQEDWLHPNAAGYLQMGTYAAKCLLKQQEITKNK